MTLSIFPVYRVKDSGNSQPLLSPTATTSRSTCQPSGLSSPPFPSSLSECPPSASVTAVSSTLIKKDGRNGERNKNSSPIRSRRPLRPHPRRPTHRHHPRQLRHLHHRLLAPEGRDIEPRPLGLPPHRHRRPPRHRPRRPLNLPLRRTRQPLRQRRSTRRTRLCSGPRQNLHRHRTQGENLSSSPPTPLRQKRPRSGQNHCRRAPKSHRTFRPYKQGVKQLS